MRSIRKKVICSHLHYNDLEQLLNFLRLARDGDFQQMSPCYIDANKPVGSDIIR